MPKFHYVETPSFDYAKDLVDLGGYRIVAVYRKNFMLVYLLELER